ncbi:phospholipase, patatin family [Salmonella bongori]|nr:phospholipase, patatin family [Salmonella bongori]
MYHGAEEGCFAANAYLITIGTLCPSRILTTAHAALAQLRRILAPGGSYGLTEGDLHLAVRASCSMPGLMAPVAHNGYWLVDGAVVNPVPVSLTRAMGADIVIAVDLQHDAHLMQQDLLSVNVANINEEGDDALPWHKRLRERFSSLTSRRGVSTPGAMEIMTTSIQVLENRLKRNRMAGDPPDILIQPFCPQISTLDFHRAHAAIAAGQLAVEKKMDELIPLVRTDV